MRSASSGTISASAKIASRFSQSGAVRSGRPCMSVQIAFAWISGPDISSLPADVACRSCSAGAVAPTTTILPRSSRGSIWPFTSAENEYVGIVPLGPR